MTKIDGSTWVCVDFRKVNAVTKKDSYPLPHIQDIYDQLARAQVFSTLDLKRGYWQIRVTEEDIEKTEFVRMPLGFANAPSAFQRTMKKVLSTFIGKSCMVYIDDIIVYNKNGEDHRKH